MAVLRDDYRSVIIIDEVQDPGDLLSAEASGLTAKRSHQDRFARDGSGAVSTLRPGESWAWRRPPDGVLLSGTREWAIEVETTAKPLDQYLAILDGYADQGVASHRYVVPPITQERILRAAEVLDVRDLVTVWDWPPVAARRD